MKQILTLVYVVATAIFSVFAVVIEMQPALFWMKLFAPNMGDTYPVVLVGLFTFLTLLLPMVILLVVLRMLPQKPQIVDGPGIWIMRERQLQSALQEIPIYINNQKIGGISMGKIRFFEAPVGRNVIIAGKGLSASEPAEFTCGTDEQLYYKLKIAQKGLLTKNVLAQMANSDKASR